MALRIDKINIRSATRLEIVFTNPINPNGIIGDNFVITTSFGTLEQLYVIDDPIIDGNTIFITTKPQRPGFLYKLEIVNLPNAPIRQLSDNSLLLTNGTANVKFFSGTELPNTLQDNIFNSIRPMSIYDVDNPNTIVSTTLSSVAKQLQKTQIGINEARSNNFLCVRVVDEEKVRGESPIDRLDNEGAYLIERVGRTRTGTTTPGSILGLTIDGDIINLNQAVIVNESLITNGGFKFSVANGPIIELTNLTLVKAISGETFNYDIDRFRYFLQTNRYDRLAFQQLLLANNQVQLSEEVALAQDVAGDQIFPEPEAGDTLKPSYKYELSGRKVLEGSTRVTQVIRDFLEPLPFVATSFTLSNAPILNSLGNTSFFRDPNSTLSFIGGNTATVFINELDFSTDTPKNQGEYTVNYVTGEIILGGQPQIGTTNEAGQVEYDFLNEFVENLDFNVDVINNELTFNSTRNLNGQIIDVSFEFEEVFREGIDYEVAAHVEIIDERINNNFIGTNQIQTLKAPITSVRRVFNETTGELYTVNRFNDTDIFIAGRDLPRQKESQFERTNFARVTKQDILATSSSSSPIVGATIFKIEFSTPGILNRTFSKIGASFDTSVLISSIDPTSPFFSTEFYYDNNLSVANNILKITTISDYLIDYTNSILYVAVPSTTDLDNKLGTISFRHNIIETRNNHILAILDINKRLSTREVAELIYKPTAITDNTVNILDLDKAGEFSFVNLDGSETITMDHTIENLRNIYPVTTLAGVTVPDLSSPFDLTGVTVSNNIIDFSVATFTLPISTPVFVDYAYGSIFLSYKYLADEILITYEFGDNAIDWSIGSAFDNANRRRSAFENEDCTPDVLIDRTTNDLKYFATYKYGASREALIDNFGKVSGVPFLSENLPTTFEREKYRHALKGMFASFVAGPTLPGIKQLVNKFTNVDPNIIERAFQQFILNRDNLFLGTPTVSIGANDDVTPTDRDSLEASGAQFVAGCFGEGLLFDDGVSVSMPFNSNFPIDEGTMEFCVRPQWNGLENDATITFDLFVDGYTDAYTFADGSTVLEKIFIGSGNINPTSIPFTLDKDNDLFALGTPTNFLNGTHEGYFIWYDIFAKRWMIKTRTLAPGQPITYSGTVTTSSDFSSVLPIIISKDGYDSYGCGDGYSTPDGYRLETGFGSDFDGYDSYTIGDIEAYTGAFMLLDPPDVGTNLVSDFILVEALGGGDDWTLNDFPTGAIDGINATYTTGSGFVAGTLVVYRDGIRMHPGDDFAETLSGFTMTSPPAIGSALVDDFIIIDGSEPDWIVNEVPTGTINGINNQFFLSSAQRLGSLRVFRNGLRMKENEDYIEGPSEVQFLISPSVGSKLIVDYIDNISVDGLGDQWFINNDPAGSIDGVNATYSLSSSFLDIDRLLVYKSGLRFRPLIDYVDASISLIIPTPAGDFGFYGPDTIRSTGTNEFEFNFFTGPDDIDGINFRSDEKHYFFDWAVNEEQNRFSVYKDGGSFLNFEVKDRRNAICDIPDTIRVSSDICDWTFGESHHVGVSWRLNTAKEIDELHLFIDGLEVPNLVRYSGRRSIFGFKYGEIEEEVLVPSAIGTELSADVEITDLELERFGIFRTRGGLVTELSLNQDYTVDTINKVINFIELIPIITGGLVQAPLALEAGDRIAIRTFGINKYRILQRKFINGVGSTFKTGLPDPIDITDVDMTAINLNTIPLSEMTIRSDKTVTEKARVFDKSISVNDRQFMRTSFRTTQLDSVLDRFGAEVFDVGANDGRIRDNRAIELPSTTTVPTGDLLDITYHLETPLITQPTDITTGRRLLIDLSGQDLIANLQGRTLEITINGEAFDINGSGFVSETLLLTNDSIIISDLLFTRIDDIVFRFI